MKRLVKESLLEFHKSRDPLKSLGLGPYEVSVHNIFNKVGVGPDEYTIEGDRTITNGSLNLAGNKKLTELPHNLMVKRTLSVSKCTELKGLPRGLAVLGDLYLMGCHGFDTLPDDIIVYGDICVDLNQRELIKYIKNSDSLKHKLYVYQ